MSRCGPSRVLSVVGSVLDVGLTRVAAQLLHWRIMVPVALAFALNPAINVFFGWYPARKTVMNLLGIRH